MRYTLEPEKDRYLLQPVDLWIRRFARSLDDRLTDSVPAIGRWMVSNSARPELANAGMWYFGARVEPRKFMYQRALNDPGFASTLVEDYVTRQKGAINAWESGQ